MSGEWIVALATVLIGVAGFVSTYVANRAGQRHAEHLAAIVDARAERDRRVALYADAVNKGRRVQRASWNWTTSRNETTKADFDLALEDYSLTVAQVRLVGSREVSLGVQQLEQTFRAHSRTPEPKIDQADARFRLTPLIEVMRDELDADRNPGEDRR